MRRLLSWNTVMPFYAVRVGRKPGVYSTWEECRIQVDKYEKPQFKKFATSEEAWDFVRNTKSSEAPKSSNTWTKSKQCVEMRKSKNESDGALSRASALSLKGSIGQIKHSLDQARTFVTQAENILNTVTSGNKRCNLDQDPSVMTKRLKSGSVSPTSSCDSPVKIGCAIVYTDGSCSDNGRNGAKAGIGVYWGQNHPRNLSERLSGRQTNNRAEIYAATRAVQQAKAAGIKELVIRTDSKFLINCITSWIHKWKLNAWTSSTGKPVINKEELEELDSELSDDITVKWEHVAAHVGIEGNEAADRLANQGATKPYQ